MSRSKLPPLAAAYHEDETAWLEMMVQLISERRFDELDYDHLKEFLSDMARRDKREVMSRLAILLVHLLKWEHQPHLRSRSWEATILHQRHELCDLLHSGVLRQYAIDNLALAYNRAVQQATLETGIEAEALPPACPWSLDEAVNAE